MGSPRGKKDDPNDPKRLIDRRLSKELAKLIFDGANRQKKMTMAEIETALGIAGSPRDTKNAEGRNARSGDVFGRYYRDERHMTLDQRQQYGLRALQLGWLDIQDEVWLAKVDPVFLPKDAPQPKASGFGNSHLKQYIGTAPVRGSSERLSDQINDLDSKPARFFRAKSQFLQAAAKLQCAIREVQALEQRGVCLIGRQIAGLHEDEKQVFEFDDSFDINHISRMLDKLCDALQPSTILITEFEDQV